MAQAARLREPGRNPINAAPDGGAPGGGNGYVHAEPADRARPARRLRRDRVAPDRAQPAREDSTGASSGGGLVLRLPGHRADGGGRVPAAPGDRAHFERTAGPSSPIRDERATGPGAPDRILVGAGRAR